MSAGESMDDETRQWLAEGIARARAGQNHEARNLLLRVVERDERNVQAWLWLAGVVSSLDDKRVALENVLTLEPDNPAAKAGLEWLDRQASGPSAGTLESSSVPPEHPYTSFQHVTEPSARDEFAPGPDGCPCCGQPVKESDARCPLCAQPLTIHVPKVTDPARVGLLATTWLVQATADLIHGLLMIAALQMMVGGTVVIGSINAVLAGAAFQSGWPTPELLRAVRFFITADAIALAWSLVAAAILLLRRPATPIVALFVAAFHLALAGSGLVLGLSSLIVAAARAIVALFIGFWLLESHSDFEWITIRQRLELDTFARSSMDYYTQGRYYRRIGQTAKAILHLQRAVELDPRRYDYRVALGNAYYTLGRYDRATEQLRAALELNPDAPDVREFLKIVKTRQAGNEPRG